MTEFQSGFRSETLSRTATVKEEASKKLALPLAERLRLALLCKDGKNSQDIFQKGKGSKTCQIYRPQIRFVPNGNAASSEMEIGYDAIPTGVVIMESDPQKYIFDVFQDWNHRLGIDPRRIEELISPYIHNGKVIEGAHVAVIDPIRLKRTAFTDFHADALPPSSLMVIKNRGNPLQDRLMTGWDASGSVYMYKGMFEDLNPTDILGSLQIKQI